ncbi:MAG: hypothetical protein LBF22_00215 [Deltaproteobacteria bacterium]|jgi:hypothetical protein|nr:hypothetical protein [Deltaproteobacteria bacterium]
MKIDSQAALNAVLLRPKTETTSTGSAEFAALVENLSSNKESTQASANKAVNYSSPGSLESLLARSSLAQLQIYNTQPVTSSSPQETTAKIEETLSLLEEYAIALGDPGTSLNEISPLADLISSNAQGLNKLSLNLKDGDPLKDLSSDTATLAAVEALKFKRGDFV